MDVSLREEKELTQKYKEDNNLNTNLSDNPIGLTCGYDMGWSKRSSGNRYDSTSGHAFLTGCHSKKILAAQVTSKRCSVCSAAKAKDEELPPDHDCPRNFKGSSKAMEAEGALALVTGLFEDHQDSNVFVEALVMDDDASTRAILSHPTNNSKDRLSLHIPQPTFLADPSHRTKVVVKAIFILAHMPKSQSECTTIDALRIKKYYGYMIKQARTMTMGELKNRCKAVIEHLFNDHTYCDLSWCKPKQVATEVNNIIANLPCKNSSSLAHTGSLEGLDHPPSPHPTRPPGDRHPTHVRPPSYYHIKIDQAELYNQLVKAYNRFTTPDRLAKSLHLFDDEILL